MDKNIPDQFSFKLCKAMISAKIPLCALENQQFREFLEEFCNRVIPESATLQQYIRCFNQDEEKAEPPASKEKEQVDEKGAEEEETETLCSFDEVVGRQYGEQENDEPEIEIIEVEDGQMKEQIDANFFAELRNKLAKWNRIQGDIKRFATLNFRKREVGEFCNINCQILSILVPEHFIHEKPVYLRVSDGTSVSSGTPGMPIRDGIYRTESDLFDNRVDYGDERCREFVHHISLFDEFASATLELKAGDIIEMRNMHAKYKQDYGNHVFSMRGTQDQPKYRAYHRGIKLLERPPARGKENDGVKREANEEAEGHVKREANEEESHEGNEPPPKKKKENSIKQEN